eukprot:1077800-Pleurochrysis_carterae.AAC.1
MGCASLASFSTSRHQLARSSLRASALRAIAAPVVEGRVTMPAQVYIQPPGNQNYRGNSGQIFRDFA